MPVIPYPRRPLGEIPGHVLGVCGEVWYEAAKVRSHAQKSPGVFGTGWSFGIPNCLGLGGTDGNTVSADDHAQVFYFAPSYEGLVCT